MARPDQKAPKGDWTTWLVLGGRGAGKTRTGAEWIHERVRQGAKRIALVAETYADGREVMVTGPSGLTQSGYPSERPSYEPSRRRVVWPGGAVGHVFSAEDPEGLRGYQFDTAWSDELAKWPGGGDTWSNLQMGLRLGDDPRQVVTTTPRTVPLLKEIMGRETTIVTRASSYANRANLAKSFFTEIAAIYEGTALGRQELLGEIIEDREGALWSWPMIEAARAELPQSFARIVVAVDPPVTSTDRSDACGIVVAGLCHGEPRRAFVIADLTVRGLSPAAWAEKAVAAYHAYEADRVVAEVNQGGDLVAEVLRTADPSVPVKCVRASRGKIVRAEPIAALYERGRVFHARPFKELEDQMTAFTGASGEASPDRLDAMVWALTDLMLGPHGAPIVRTL
ncbi:DNA-packaging protein [Parvularcula lutaonensis]|uniref:DNA-packaging protein n=1 Tax=Parvularcula lutaonensis TaxID=491923 RepID=A0ABV7MF69_9PROT|nr:terminase family protein [Parvularcula lutaonensis]GGY53156.1 large terminase [Parvularcula lutaonensis]